MHDPIDAAQAVLAAVPKALPNCTVRLGIVPGHITVAVQIDGEEAWSSVGVQIADIRREGTKPLIEAIQQLNWLGTTLAQAGREVEETHG